MFDNNPTIFKERTDCLNHLFCVIGNGYFWKNGELVEESYEKFTEKDYKKSLMEHLFTL